MISKDNFYDHYKDSFEQQKSYIAKRDHYTIALFLMVVVLCLQICDTKILNDSINALINKEIDCVKLDFKYISISLSYVFLWLIIQYYQVCLTIENMYGYIDYLEKKLTKGGFYKIEREGVNYLKSYPWLKVISHRIYVLVFPLLFIFIAFTGAYSEVKHIYFDGFSLFSFFTLIAYIFNVFVSLLYISNRWFHEEVFSKEHFPNLSKMEKFKRYIGLTKEPKK